VKNLQDLIHTIKTYDMKPLSEYSVQTADSRSASLLHFLLSGLIACILLYGCGEGNSNNLPEASDSASINQAPADSNLNGRPGGAKVLTPAPADTGKLGGNWFLVAVLPSDTAAGKIPTINFDEASHKFTGNTGCNNMRGNFTVTDSTLKIDEQIITTKMACVGYNEDAFLKNLPKVTGFRFENGMLVLLNDQAELSRWTREPVKPTTKTT
jgi:heat shock protein HslJ